MTPQHEPPSPSDDNKKKIRVRENGPDIVSGSIPLIKEEIRNDSGGFCSTWHDVKTYPLQRTVCPLPLRALRKTNHSVTRPMLKSTLTGPRRHARFCMRARGIWNLTRQFDNREARKIAIEEAGKCPSGRLVLWDKKTKKAIEPEFEKSIVVIEYPSRDEHGLVWVRGGISVEALVMCMKSATA